ncbi:hypothetical protein EU800_23150 [Tropicimonas sp. IMCC6043]|nr:hypothetical protein EU800_23150 [Tropicimonas sp. IMCC6043]
MIVNGCFPEVEGADGIRTVDSPMQIHAEDLVEEIEHRAPPKLLLQDDSATGIHPVKLKDRLGQVDPECCNFHVVGSFLSWFQTAPAWHIAMPFGWSRPHHQKNVAFDGAGG